MTEAATEQPGKIQQLVGLWEKAGDGELLPRAFGIELAVATASAGQLPSPVRLTRPGPARRVGRPDS